MGALSAALLAIRNWPCWQSIPPSRRSYIGPEDDRKQPNYTVKTRKAAIKARFCRRNTLPAVSIISLVFAISTGAGADNHESSLGTSVWAVSPEVGIWSACLYHRRGGG